MSKHNKFFGLPVTSQELKAIDLIAARLGRKRSDAVRFVIRETARRSRAQEQIPRGALVRCLIFAARRGIKSRFGAKSSLAIDRAVIGLESSSGIEHLFWRVYKLWLELHIPTKGDD